jgi:hypothetical protein
VDTIDEAETTEVGNAGPERDRKMIRQVARVISGLDQAQWKEAGKEGQKPHLATARRVLNTIERIKARREAGTDDAAQDDDEV